MSFRIRLMQGYERIAYARYQSAIAFGCYLGPSSKELLTLRWNHLFNQIYKWRFEERYNVVIDKDLHKVATTNFDIVKPERKNELVLPHLFNSNKSVSAGQFNASLIKLFTEFLVNTPEPNFQTLRKTFARKIFEDMAYSDLAVEILSDQLGYSRTLTRTYLRKEGESNISIY